MNALLPLEFSPFEHLVPDWAIEDGHERYLKRVNSSMEEIQAFYDEVFPQAEEAVAYIDKFDYSEPLPEDVANLRNLLYSLITVSLAVELWKQPRVKHSANTILTRVTLITMGLTSAQLESSTSPRGSAASSGPTSTLCSAVARPRPFAPLWTAAE